MIDTLITSPSFSGLDLYAIFVGANGHVALLAMMCLALAGNLYKKRARFIRKEDSGPFDWKFWLKHNFVGMLSGMFLSWLCCRLLNVVIPLLHEVLPPNLDVSELLILSSIYIGYRLDEVEAAIEKKLGVKQ